MEFYKYCYIVCKECKTNTVVVKMRYWQFYQYIGSKNSRYMLLEGLCRFCLQSEHDKVNDGVIVPDQYMLTYGEAIIMLNSPRKTLGFWLPTVINRISHPEILSSFHEYSTDMIIGKTGDVLTLEKTTPERYRGGAAKRYYAKHKDKFKQYRKKYREKKKLQKL